MQSSLTQWGLLPVPYPRVLGDRSCAQPRFPFLHVFAIEAVTLPGVASALCGSTRLRGKGAFS